MPDLEDRIAALEANASTVDTHLDAVTERLTVAENTIAAIGDSVKNFAPDNIVDAGAAIADIKERVNAFSMKVFGDVTFPIETPASV